MRRQIHYPAFAGLIVALVSASAALYFALSWHSANPAVHQLVRPRAWVSVFGDVATAILIVAVPLIIWLGHKAFFSRFRR